MEKKTFNQLLEELAAKNWKVRKLLESFGGYEGLPENVKLLIDKQLDVHRETVFVANDSQPQSLDNNTK